MSIRRPNDAPLATAAGGGRSLRAVLAAGREGWKRKQAEREHERTKSWLPMALSMPRPLNLNPRAAAWNQEMTILALGNRTNYDPLLRAELQVDRDIVTMFDENHLQHAKIVIERKVTPTELWNMENEVWNKLAELYKDMATTIGNMLLMFKGSTNPDIKKKQDEIDEYVSHRNYYKAMGLAVDRLFYIVHDSPPNDNGYSLNNDAQKDQEMKILAFDAFKQHWYMKAGQAALLEAVRRHLGDMHL